MIMLKPIKWSSLFYFTLMCVLISSAADAQSAKKAINNTPAYTELSSNLGDKNQPSNQRGSVHAGLSSAPQNIDSPSYILGVGDVIRVSVWKESDLSQTVVIRPDGFISLPLIGDIKVIGETALDAQESIREKLLSLLTNPQVTIIVLEIHSRQVYITGEVGRPGAYQIEGAINVLQLIARAGGLTQYAHKKDIYILTKQTDKPLRFNYSKVVRGLDKEHNILLVPGDTVVVP